MDYASILRVLVQVDGLTKATGGLATLDAAQKSVGGSATSMGRDIDTTMAKTRALQGDVAKATTVTRGLGDGIDKTGQQAARAGDGLGHAATAAGTLQADLKRAQVVSQDTSTALSALLGDTDDYSAGLMRSHGMSTQAVDAAQQLGRAREALAGQIGGLLNDEDDLASVMQRSHQAHAEAARATTDLETATSRLPGPISQVASGFSEASLSVQKAREEIDRTGSVSRSTMSELANLGSRGVGGLDRDLNRTQATIRKAQTELASTGEVSRRTARDLATLGNAGGGAGGGIGALLGALSAGGGGLSAFGITVLVTIPTVIALVGVLGALAAALGPLAGLGAAAGVGLSAAGQGFGVFKLATMGVADALKEQTTQQASAGAAAGQSAQQQRSAARAIQSAMDGVRTAHEQVRTATQALTAAEDQAKAAQVGLTQARTDAARGLVDMAAGLQTARLAESDATWALTDAKKALADLVNGPDSGKVADATSAVTSALHSQQGALLAVGDAQRAYDDLIAGPGPQKLLEATQSVTEALHGQQAAQLALTDAKKAYDELIAGPTAEDAGKAQLSLSQAQHAQQQAVLDLADAQKSANAILSASSATDAQKAKAALALANAQDQVAAANFRVSDAQDALKKVQAGPTDEDKAKALLGIQQAQDQVNDSTSNVTETQAALDKLNAGATDSEKAKALLAVQQAQDQVTGATTAQTEAQSALDKLNAPASAEDLSKALLAVQGAQADLVGSTRDRLREEKDFGKAQAAGVAGSAQVLAAAKAVKTATQQEADAHLQLRDALIAVDRAEQAVGDAQLNAADSASKAATGAAKLNAAMDALPAPAQAFVRQLISLKPKLDELRATAAAGFFPGAGEGLAAAARNFEPVKKVVGETGTALGDLSREAGDLVGSQAFGKDIETIGGRNAKIIGTLGDAALHVVDGIRHVLVVAGPLTTWLANTADGWAKNADAAARTGRENGKLADFFERTRNVLERLGSITGHVAHGLLGVGKAGTDSGNDTLKAIDKAADRFDDWANSTKGQSSLTKFFEDSKDLIANLIPVLQGVGKATATIGFGPMNTALKLAGTHAEALTYAFLTYKTVAGAAAFANTALTAGLFLLRGATYDAATAQWALNAAEDANPIGLIILAIAALAAGLIYAYTHVKWFHDAVDSTFSWIKDHWPLLLGILTGPIGLAVEQIITHWGQIKTATVEVWGAITGFLTGAWGRIGSAASTAWDGVGDSILGPVRGARDLLGNEILPGIGNRLDSAWSLAKTGTSTAWGAVKDFILTPIRAARDLIGDEILPGIDNRLDGAWETAKGGASTAWGTVKETILGALRGARDVLDTGENILGGITNRLSVAWGNIQDGMKAFGLIITNILSRAFGGAANAVIGFINLIIKAINLIPGIPKIAAIGKVDVPDALSVKDAQKQAAGMAKGGAFARTGGHITAPITLMGEEAPLHSEWVIPTNPAYRDRAVALHQAAGKAIGLAQGGTYSSTSYGPPWTGINGSGTTATGVDLHAAPHVLGVAVDPAVLKLGSMLKIQPNPFHTDQAFKAFDTGKAIQGRHLDFYDWRGRAEQYGWGSRTVDVDVQGGGGGILNAVGGAISGAAGAVSGAVSDAAGLIAKGPGAILDMLPGIGDLPDWLKDTGRYVLDKATDWIKDKVGSLIPDLGGGGGGSGTGHLAGGKLQLPKTFTATHATEGLPGYPAIDVFAPPGTGVLAPADGVISRFSGRNPSEGAYEGAGGPFGWTIYLDAAKASYFLTHFGSRAVNVGEHVHHGDLLGTVGDYPGSVPDHIHEGLHALAQGGVFGGLPFGGSFAQGGIVPGPLGAPTAIIAHGGETVVANGRGASDAAPQVNFYGPVSMRDERDAVVLAREVGWEIAR